MFVLARFPRNSALCHGGSSRAPRELCADCGAETDKQLLAKQALKIMTLFRRTARGFCPRPPPRVSRNVNAQAGISAGEVEIDRRDAERESDEGGGGCSKVTHNVFEGDWSYLSTGRL